MDKPSSRTTFLDKILARNAHIYALVAALGFAVPFGFKSNGIEWLVGSIIMGIAGLAISAIVYGNISRDDDYIRLVRNLITPLVIASSICITSGGIFASMGWYAPDSNEKALEEQLQVCNNRLMSSKQTLNNKCTEDLKVCNGRLSDLREICHIAPSVTAPTYRSRSKKEETSDDL